jgi:DNA-directed RNA polymerase specialized sigma24 family protein
LISLKFFLRATNVEIAATLGLTPTNVGVKVHRALKELRRKLEPQLFGADHE